MEKETATKVAFNNVLEAHQNLINGGLIQGEHFTKDNAIQQMFTLASDLQQAIAHLRTLDSKMADISASLVNHKYYVATLGKALSLQEIDNEAHTRFPNLR